MLRDQNEAPAHPLGYRHSSSSRLTSYYHSNNSSPTGRSLNYSDNEASYNMHVPRAQHVSARDRHRAEYGFAHHARGGGSDHHVTSPARAQPRSRGELQPRDMFERVGSHNKRVRHTAKRGKLTTHN